MEQENQSTMTGEELRFLRRAHNFTQIQVANALGFSTIYIVYLVEHGKRKLKPAEVAAVRKLIGLPTVQQTEGVANGQ